jgi:outer membrane protein with beta-barrel domain
MRYALIAAALLAFAPAAARAQADPPLTGFDVSASVGLFAADRSGGGTDGASSWSSGLFRGVSAGYYWTDHLKTEVAFAAPGQTDAYSYSSRQLPNRVTVLTEDERTFTATRVSLAQAYQFGRNAMFHPYAVAGVDVDREQVALERRVLVGSTLAPVEDSSATTVRARAFAGAGFKAYVSERAFFRGDFTFDLASQVQQIAWTAGFGVDFTRPCRAPRAAAASATPGPAVRGREPIEIWRAYATALPIGAIVDVAAAGGDHLVAQLVDVDDSGILVRPHARVRTTARHIAFDRLEMLRLHVEPTQGERAGAVAGAAGVAAGTFFGSLMLLFLTFGG